jgi:hypothetical protein
MVTRINGAPDQGFYFSKDVRTLTIVATGGDFVNDLTVKTTQPHQAAVVNSTLEVTLEAVATRATVIGLTVVNATTCHVLVDYANAFTAGQTETDDPSVEKEIADLINLDSRLSATTLDTFSGFAGLAQVVAT